MGKQFSMRITRPSSNVQQRLDGKIHCSSFNWFFRYLSPGSSRFKLNLWVFGFNETQNNELHKKKINSGRIYLPVWIDLRVRSCYVFGNFLSREERPKKLRSIFIRLLGRLRCKFIFSSIRAPKKKHTESLTGLVCSAGCLSLFSNFDEFFRSAWILWYYKQFGLMSPRVDYVVDIVGEIKDKKMSFCGTGHRLR